MVPRLAAQISPGVSQITPYSTTPPSVFDGTDTRLSQSGACTGTCFSKKLGTVDAVGEALHGQGPVAEVGHHDRGHPQVVVEHLSLGEPASGIEDLLEIGDRTARAHRRPS